MIREVLKLHLQNNVLAPCSLKREQSIHDDFCLFLQASLLALLSHVLCSRKARTRLSDFTYLLKAELLWHMLYSLQAINAGEGVEKREPSYTVGGNAN